MKRIIALLTVTLMLIQCLPVAGLASETDTDRVSAMEFCELYTKRIMEFNEKYGKSIGELNTYVLSISSFDDGDTYKAGCSCGFLTLNKTDLTIESLTTAVMDLDADPEEEDGYNVMMKALFALSALEMSDIEADSLEMLHDIDPSRPEDVFMAFLEVFNDTINPAISSNMDNLKSLDGVLVYQGNYDYYAKYIDYPDSGKSIYLTAEARK